MDLELAGADRRLHALPVAACLGECPSDGGFRACRRSAGRLDLALGRTLQHPLDGLGLESARPQASKLARRAGQHHDHGRPSVSSTKPGAVPASPREIAPSGSVACLVTPVANSVYGLPMRSANMRETRFDLPLETHVHDE